MSIELKKVRSLFEKRTRVTDVAFLIREIANRMNERLSVMKITPLRIMDAGCGHGDDLQMLSEKFPEARLTGVDASFAMLSRARGYRCHAGNRLDYVCGDFGLLPVRRSVFDMIWSNLSLHWHEDIASVFKEWVRVLAQEGLMMFSCFGPGTWSALRNFCNGLDAYSHILEFNSMREIGDKLIGAGFVAPVLEREWITVTYATAEKMLADIRAFGGNPLKGRPKGLWGKKSYRKLMEYLDAEQSEYGLLSLEFEVIYAHAFKEKKLVRQERIIEIFR